jgi:queuosine biosynthesis protein QueC
MSSFVALLSGGLDSTVAAFMARQRGPVAVALVFDYGQRAAKQEKNAAAKIARRLDAECRAIQLPFLKEVTRTALVMNEKVIPQIKMGQLDDRSETVKSAQQVWVPNRNGLFLNIAAAIAEGEGYSEIVVGFNAEEAATFPDNSANFVNRAESFFELSTQSAPKVFAPTIGMNKSEIVMEGMRVDAPFREVYSCYLGQKKMCARCESCLRSIRAYQKAGVWETMRERFEAL